MRRRTVLLFVALVFLAAAAISAAFTRVYLDEIEPKQPPVYSIGPEENGSIMEIRLLEPKPGDVIRSPLEIRGEARGYWYFEGDFPIRLLDGDGEIIAAHFATAGGSWMTEDFVPFTSLLEFETPDTEIGTLILQKDNPSGLPEMDDELRIQVRFNQAEDGSR